MNLPEFRYYFEDFTVGTTYWTAGRTITEADLVAFVNCSGLNGELFTNVEYAKSASVFGARLSPGLLPFVLCEGLNSQGPMRGSGMALLGIEIEFSEPVLVGDTVHAEVEVIEARRSKSRPGAGLVRFRHRIMRQDGQAAITYTAVRMIKARPAEGDSE